MSVTEISRPDVGREAPEPQEARAGRPLWSRWAMAALILSALVGVYALGLHRYLSWDYLRSHLDLLQAEVQRHLLMALVVFFLIYVSTTALSLPVATGLTLMAGALFGRWLGTGLVSLASTLGATLAMLAGRYILRDGLRARFGDRLEAIDRGVERDGPYYLFMLRLVPAFPFVLVNLGMGLTRMRALPFALVSLVGMLPGTFLYVNAGTELGRIDEPGEILSPRVLVALALLGIVPLAIRMLVRWKVRRRTVGLAIAGLLLAAVVGIGLRTYFRYRTAPVMAVPVTEYANDEYPEDPAGRSLHFGQYTGRSLRLEQRDDTHFDLIFEPRHPHIATVAFRNVDVSLMTPSIPEWTKGDPDLIRIALTDRQWNRQQVRFEVGSPQVEISGGDGWEKSHIKSAELAKNCLNAGLWEVLLFTEEDGKKALYYQDWFTFPLGHYARIFGKNTGLPYWRHWYYLEHWFDPAGTPVRLESLRRVVTEREVPARFDSDEALILAGEQARKKRTTLAENVRTWGDFYDGRHKVRFATFIKPGRYSVRHPWKNEYGRMTRFEKAILRETRSPARDGSLHELELAFRDERGEVCRFLVGGFELGKLPQLPASKYPDGLYMPMGIGTPPFFQGYEELRKRPPQASPYFSVTLDGEGRWIDHHKQAIDGPVMHRDADDPSLLHLYLLSYERHSLIGHWVISTGPGRQVASDPTDTERR
jgi:uncharacterized membrane protein YdjX (TVP38/TMEM64 family)